MKKLLSQKRYIISGIFGILLLLGISWFSQKDDTKKQSSTEKTWQTIPVKIADDFSSIKIPGKVKSNKFAIISPRRSGIIQDLLVDIGDEVLKGQTIGSMLPEGVEGQSSAAIAEASARLQKARAELTNAEGVSIGAISVANKQFAETNIQSETQSILDQETKKQLVEKQSEALLVATQAWENIKSLLFGTNSNKGNRSVIGNFSNSNQRVVLENLANEIQKMEESEEWGNPKIVRDHLVHLENFLTQTEILYKSAIESGSFSQEKISGNISSIQGQQLKVSQTKQSILALEEKQKRFSSLQAEKNALAEKSKEAIGLVESQQDLSVTQAEKNIQVALANYNAALIKSGHQKITSPFTGIITARMVEVGESVMPNTALFYLEGAQTARSEEALFEVHFQLPESWKNKVSLGDSVELRTMHSGEKIPGKIFRLSSQINLNTNSIMATAIINPPIPLSPLSEGINTEEEKKEARVNFEESTDDLRNNTEQFTHGQSVFVYATDLKSHTFSVPTSSLKKRGSDYFVWKMKDEKPFQIPVHLVAEDGEFSQIFSNNITSEDHIIKTPSVSLFKKK